MARAFLERKQTPETRLEADLLVAHALGLDRLRLLMQLDRPVTGEEVGRARDLLVRRGRHEPVAYIVGEREFYARPFQVGPGVLVPRPETELLIDLARDHARERGLEGARVLDVGTGSGCVAITLALELERPEVLGVERSAAALAVARANGQALGATVEWLHGDGLELGDTHAPYDLVLANPPYVDPAARDTLAPQVLEHEPAEALFAPAADPDFWARELLDRAARWLRPGGMLAIELGYDQAERLRGRDGTRFEKDLAGVERALVYVS